MKINKVNEMNEKLITKSELQDWMSDNDEDALLDGPFWLSGEQNYRFLLKVNSDKKFLKACVKDGMIDEGEEIPNVEGYLNVSNDDKISKMTLNLFVEFLAEEGITEIPQ